MSWPDRLTLSDVARKMGLEYHRIPSPQYYPLVMTNVAIENGHS